MTGAQVYEARRLLDWSVKQLASACNLGTKVIWIFEASGHMPKPMFGRTNPQDRLAMLRTTLEAAGIEFIPENGSDGAGVRMRKANP